MDDEALAAALGGVLNQVAAERREPVDSEAVREEAYQRLLSQRELEAVRQNYTDQAALRADLDLLSRLIAVMGELVASADANTADLSAMLARHGLETDVNGDVVRANVDQESS